MSKGALHIVWLLIWGVGNVWAQTVGTCAKGQSEAYLDIGNVRARMANTGGLFWNGAPNVYEVPKGSGTHALFNADLRIGGWSQDSLHIAATRYGLNEFWPGPITSISQPLHDCAPYDRFAVLYRDDVEQYEKNGLVSARLAQWPWQWGAPVLDGDGDSTNYNLAGGDRPELLGDQTVWWVMNDVGNEHRRSQGLPLGMEVRVSAFAFNTVGAVGNATFYRYQFHYKGIAPLDSAYVGFYVDADVGNFDNDYIGSDTSLAMAYAYNGTSIDSHYGDTPPAIGFSFLQGPTARVDGRDNDLDRLIDEAGERLRATSVTTQWGGGGVQSLPDRAHEFYQYMQGLWRDGRPVTEGGDGRGYTDKAAPFMFPGDPVTGAFWSEMNIGEGRANTPADRRFTIAAGPFDMKPDDVDEIVLAIVWSRGDSNLDSVRKLREDMAYIQSITPELIEPRHPAAKVGTTEAFALGYHHAYPNPVTQSATIRYSLAQAEQVRLAIYDVLGREVAILVEKRQEAGWHEAHLDVRDLAAGGYVYRLQVGQQVATETIVVAR